MGTKWTVSVNNSAFCTTRFVPTFMSFYSTKTWNGCFLDKKVDTFLKGIVLVIYIYVHLYYDF